jgi:hypothetical protein
LVWFPIFLNAFLGALLSYKAWIAGILVGVFITNFSMIVLVTLLLSGGYYLVSNLIRFGTASQMSTGILMLHILATFTAVLVIALATGAVRHVARRRG